MQCPDCDKELGFRSVCGCGWKKPTTPQMAYEKPRAKCCHDLCISNAICKIKTVTGWANVCERHYLSHFQKQADDYCAEHGIVTLAQKRKFVRDKAKGVYRMRQPGEDDLGGDAA